MLWGFPTAQAAPGALTEENHGHAPKHSSWNNSSCLWLSTAGGSGIPSHPKAQGSAGMPPFTCVIPVVVGVGHAPQPRVGLVELSAGVVAELSSRVRVALPGFDAFPPPGLVFVIRVILFMLHPEPLGFLHKGTFLVFAQ